MSRTCIAGVLLALLIMACAAAAQAPSSNQSIQPAGEETVPLPRYLEVRPNIGTGGQPTEAGLRILAQKGYTSIVNFRTAEEMAAIPYEERLAAELGLKYFSIPFRGQEPKEVQAAAFNQLMDALKGEKVFVHCTVANRVGGMMMIRLALREGMDVQAAETEAAKIGLRSEALREFARQVIQRQQGK